MSTPPELEFLGTCVALATGCMTLWQFAVSQSKRNRIVLLIVSVVLILGSAISFAYRLLHKAPSVVATSAPAPVKPTPPAPAPAIDAKITPASPSPARHKRHTPPAETPSIQNSAPSGFAFSGGKVDHPTVNNYAAPPEPIGPNNAQLADSAKDIARRIRELQKELDWHDANEREAHSDGRYGPIPPSFYSIQLNRIQPIRAEANALRRQILNRIPPQPQNYDVIGVLDDNSLAGAHPLYGVADYFDRLAETLLIR